LSSDLKQGQDPDPEHCHDAEIDTAVTFLYVMNADPVMPFLFYLSQQIIREGEEFENLMARCQSSARTIFQRKQFPPVLFTLG
jgi:hypothetical protein